MFKEEIILLEKKVRSLENRLKIYEGQNNPSSQKPVFLKKESSESINKHGTKIRRKKGRKKGHKGFTLVLTPDRIQNDFVDQCNNCHEKMDNSVIKVKQEVLGSKLVHIDETGYVSNIDERELNWIWSASTPNEMIYEFKKGMSTDDLKELWTKDPGTTIAIVDGWLAYKIFPKIQRCWDHVFRESHDLARRRGGLAQALDDELTLLFHDIKRYRE